MRQRTIKGPIDTRKAPANVTGLEDADMLTNSGWSSLPMPVSSAGTVSLSFDTLAKLFAAQRRSLLDADLTTIETRVLFAKSAEGQHHE